MNESWFYSISQQEREARKEEVWLSWQKKQRWLFYLHPGYKVLQHRWQEWRWKVDKGWVGGGAAEIRIRCGHVDNNLWTAEPPRCSYNRRARVDKFFNSMDRDYDGRLSLEEFLGEETPIEKLFKLMDRDGDGFVTKKVKQRHITYCLH